MKPVIGLTCYHDWKEQRHRQNDTYIEAVRKAGGLPLLLPCLADLADIGQQLDLVAGLLICGGPDVDPLFFGEEPVIGMGNIHPAMDAYEIPLIIEALERDMPVLGICRGVQMQNVALGGTLIQHIPHAVTNSLLHQQQAPRSYRTHSVRVVSGTGLARLFPRETLRVNSFHHQAVGQVAPGFVASAFALDGIIEAVESVKHTFVMGVQWHPECMWNEAENYDPLFNALVGAARKYKTRR
ncbi:MAG: gamma-glutamyl-gamma-aminobutyrate hydrolase family protein [Thermaerobacter sp.]|nr:gamma-glutamyl-gamma-aminobutyrate hydrolase family protein [Thermaerobacter sp.]